MNPREVGADGDHRFRRLRRAGRRARARRWKWRISSHPSISSSRCADADRLADDVRCAGAVFVGPWAPASVGDYVAGTNHVLPTARTARFSSALRVDDFRTHIGVVSLDERGLAALAPHVIEIADAEGLVRARASRSGSAPSPTPATARRCCTRIGREPDRQGHARHSPVVSRRSEATSSR